MRIAGREARTPPAAPCDGLGDAQKAQAEEPQVSEAADDSPRSENEHYPDHKDSDPPPIHGHLLGVATQGGVVELYRCVIHGEKVAPARCRSGQHRRVYGKDAVNEP